MSNRTNVYLGHLLTENGICNKEIRCFYEWLNGSKKEACVLIAPDRTVHLVNGHIIKETVPLLRSYRSIDDAVDQCTAFVDWLDDIRTEDETIKIKVFDTHALEENITIYDIMVQCMGFYTLLQTPESGPLLRILTRVKEKFTGKVTIIHVETLEAPQEKQLYIDYKNTYILLTDTALTDAKFAVVPFGCNSILYRYLNEAMRVLPSRRGLIYEQSIKLDEIEQILSKIKEDAPKTETGKQGPPKDFDSVIDFPFAAGHAVRSKQRRVRSKKRNQ